MTAFSIGSQGLSSTRQLQGLLLSLNKDSRRAGLCRIDINVTGGSAHASPEPSSESSVHLQQQT